MITVSAEYLPMGQEMIDAHLTYLRAQGYSPNTIRDARRCLTRLDRDLPYGLPVALPEELAEWLARDNWSRQTRKTYRDHIARFFAWATDPADPWVDRNPAIGLRAPRVPTGLPRPAADHDVQLCVTTAAQPWRMHCILAAYAGLRPCEIAQLRREDVDEQWLHVHRGKGGRDRRIPTHPAVWAAVRDLPPGPVTRQVNGRPATAQWVSQMTARYMHRTLRLDITLYNLRHWYGTVTQAVQGDARVTQELMGHASLTTTARYTAVSDLRLRAAIAALPDLTIPTCQPPAAVQPARPAALGRQRLVGHHLDAGRATRRQVVDAAHHQDVMLVGHLP